MTNDAQYEEWKTQISEWEPLLGGEMTPDCILRLQTFIQWQYFLKTHISNKTQD